MLVSVFLTAALSSDRSDSDRLYRKACRRERTLSLHSHAPGRVWPPGPVGPGNPAVTEENFNAAKLCRSGRPDGQPFRPDGRHQISGRLWAHLGRQQQDKRFHLHAHPGYSGLRRLYGGGGPAAERRRPERRPGVHRTGRGDPGNFGHRRRGAGADEKQLRKRRKTRLCTKRSAGKPKTAARR